MRKIFALLLVGALTASMWAVSPKAYADKWEDLITEAASEKIATPENFDNHNSRSALIRVNPR